MPDALLRQSRQKRRALLRPLLRVPTIWHLRDNWAGALVGRMADLGPHRIIANSRATAAFLQKDMKHPHKVVVVHNPVDVAEFSPEGDTFPLETAGPRVGLVAALTGFQPQMAPWYRALDVVVNASIRPEPFGRTLLEAMACGKAVVGPNAGGIPEFVQHGKKGLLYEMGNVGTLAEAVLPLLRETAWRQKLGSAGRETAVRRFAPQPQAQAILRILLESSLGVLTRKIC